MKIRDMVIGNISYTVLLYRIRAKMRILAKIHIFRKTIKRMERDLAGSSSNYRNEHYDYLVLFSHVAFVVRASVHLCSFEDSTSNLVFLIHRTCNDSI